MNHDAKKRMQLVAVIERTADGGEKKKYGERTDVLDHFGYKPVEDDERFDEDTRCLANVVHLLLSHRRRQRLAQRNAILEGLVFALSEAYREYRKSDAPAAQLQECIVEGCHQLGLHVGDEELNELVLDRGDESDSKTPSEEDGLEGDATSIVAMEGAVEAAKKVIGKLVGRSEGTLAAVRRSPHPLEFARRPFGRFVARRARLAYAIYLQEEQLRTTERALHFSELGELNERTGALLDRLCEGLMRRTAEDPQLRDVVLTPDCRSKLASFEDAEQVKLRAATWSAINAGPLAVQTSGLPESLREVAMQVATTTSSSSHDEVSALDARLERAIKAAAVTSTAEAVRQTMRGMYGSDLDTAPTVGREAGR